MVHSRREAKALARPCAASHSGSPFTPASPGLVSVLDGITPHTQLFFMSRDDPKLDLRFDHPYSKRVAVTRPANSTIVPVFARGQFHSQRVLLFDSESEHRERLLHRLLAKGLAVEICHDSRDAVRKLKQDSERYTLVIVHLCDLSRPWGRILQILQEACEHSRRHCGPLFLCITRAKGVPHLRLLLENMGARVAYER